MTDSAIKIKVGFGYLTRGMKIVSISGHKPHEYEDGSKVDFYTSVENELYTHDGILVAETYDPLTDLIVELGEIKDEDFFLPAVEAINLLHKADTLFNGYGLNVVFGVVQNAV